jgi:hypothetical protein
VSRPDDIGWRRRQIGILARHELAHALDGLAHSGLGKQNEVLQRVENGRAHAQRDGRIALADVIGDGDEILDRTRCEA